MWDSLSSFTCRVITNNVKFSPFEIWTQLIKTVQDTHSMLICGFQDERLNMNTKNVTFSRVCVPDHHFVFGIILPRDLGGLGELARCLDDLPRSQQGQSGDLGGRGGQGSQGNRGWRGPQGKGQHLHPGHHVGGSEKRGLESNMCFY